MMDAPHVDLLGGVLVLATVGLGVACDRSSGTSEAAAQEPVESGESEPGSASDDPERGGASGRSAAEPSGESAVEDAQSPERSEAAPKVSPGFVFGGHPHTEETIQLELYGAEDTEIPVRAEPRSSAEVVDQFGLAEDEEFDIVEARTVVGSETFESPVAFVIGEGAKHIEGPGHVLPLEVERGASIAVARKYRGEGTSDSYIWYDGSVYVNPNDCCLKLVDPDVMESDAGFANRKPRVVPDRDGTVYEALGLLGHQSFSTASDSSSWWGRVEISGEKKGWIRMDREEIRVEKCFPNFCKEVGVGAD